MRATKAGLIALVILGTPLLSVAGPSGGSVSGKVTVLGNVPKPKALDLAKEPDCVKIHAADPLYAENVMVGPGNTLRNVVVYISAGDNETAPAPVTPLSYVQKDCHYTTHVLPLRVGQEVKISNEDPFSHNIHPLAKINREWNKMQPPGTPPFSYAYDKEEFIPIKCNIHPWMQGYFVVLRTSHFAVTGDDGRFDLSNLPPGHYVITAWHEAYGTQSKEVTIGGSEAQFINFSFTAKP